jgi:serine/threonine-protein kinase
MPAEISTDQAIFLEAVEYVPQDRWEAFVKDRCADDVELHSRVERLLRAHRELGEFHDGRPSVRNSATVGPQPIEESGTMIGPYRLLEQIGEGGMGTVYMAQQTEPVRRKVALKIIKPGMDTRQVVARFAAEQQALAMMNHPNIAQVFDAGTTDDRSKRDAHARGGEGETGRGGEPNHQPPFGISPSPTRPLSPSTRPYFVMELVRGIPITEYCDQHQLDPRQRLELFVTVCRAVQHAHQKGIIHRDLKPSNVLVEQHDVTPVPKIIDFGVAKAINRELTEKTLFTNFAQLIGTPLYMSPEQAELSGLDVDTRSDIYSLGVLLYELLTGTTPFDKERLRMAGYDEVRRIIREEEPQRPSARFSTLDAQVASTISASRGVDERQLNRALRGDLDWIVMKCLEKDRNRRYESASDLAADVQRHLDHEPIHARPPRPFAGIRKWSRRHRGLLIATAATLLVSGIVLAGSIGWIVRDRTARKSLAEAAASSALDEATRLIERESWANALASVKRAEAVLASGGYGGEWIARARELRRNIELILRLEEIQFSPETELVWKGTVRLYDSEADRKYAQAFREYGIDVETCAPEAAAGQIQRSNVRLDLITALDSWARWRKSYHADDQSWKRLIEIARLADPDPVRNGLRASLEKKLGAERRAALAELAESISGDNLPTQTISLMARLTRASGDPDRAVGMFKVALRRHPDDFWTNLMLGECYMEMRPAQLNEAIRYLTAARALRPESPIAHTNLGRALGEKGLQDEEIACYREAIRLAPEMALPYQNLGSALEKKGLFDEAIVCARKAIHLQPDIPGVHITLGVSLGNKGLLDEAIASFREAIRLDPGSANARLNLGVSLVKKGSLDDAAPFFREAIRLEPNQAQAHAVLGGVLLQQNGLLDEAIACFREAIQLQPNNADYHGSLGLALTRVGLLDEAIASFREAIRLNSDIVDFHGNLGTALEKKGLRDQAIACYRQVLRLDPKDELAHEKLWHLLIDAGEMHEALAILEHLPPGWFREFRIFQYHPDDQRAEAAFIAMQKHLRRQLRDKPEVNLLDTLAGTQLKGPFRHLSDDREAFELIKQAYDLGGKEEPVVWMDYGWALYRQGQFTEALEWLKKAEGTPAFEEWPYVAFGLALVQLKLGAREEALNYYRQGVEMLRKRKMLQREEISVLRETASALGDQTTVEELLRDRWPNIEQTKPELK